MRLVVAVALLCAGAAALQPGSLPCVRRRPGSTPSVSLATVGTGGNYGVGDGQWGPAPEQQKPRPVRMKQAKSAKPADGGRGRGRGRSRGRAGGRGRGSGSSPVLDGVLRKMGRLGGPSASAEDVDAALRGKRLTARDYTTVLHGLKLRREWRVALLVGDWLRARAAASSPDVGASAYPNRQHYQALLGACAASGQAEAAGSVAEDMVASGMALDRMAIGALILAHERAGDWAATASLLEQLEGLPPLAAPPPGAPAGGVDPVAFAYSSVIRAHDGAGLWEAALDFLDRMVAGGAQPDAHCYAAALGACRTGKQAGRARALIEAVRDEGRIAPNSVMYTLAMAACNAAGEWQACLDLLAARRADGTPLDSHAFSVAMGACAGAREAETALALLEEMRGDAGTRGNAFAWNNAMVACNKAGQPAKALELYDEMRGGACTISDFSVAAALVAARATEDWQRAQAVFDGAKVAPSVMCYNALLDALHDGAQWKLLLRYFDEMKKLGVRPDSRSYERAIEACDRVDSDRALILFAEMSASGI